VNPLDARGRSKAIVNREFARRYGPDVIGRHVTIDQSNDPWEIVGIIGNVDEDGPAAAPMPYVYACLVPGSWPDPEYVVRVRGDLGAAMANVRRIARSVAPGRAIFGMQPLEHVLAGALDQPRLDASVLTVFAAAALTLASLGLYSVLMLLVSERARELGVRMALGATSGQVVGLVLGGAFRLVGAGVAAGLICSAGAARLLRSVVFGVDPLDAATLAAAVATLALVALAAAAIPARRAALIDPIDAMRAE
jgi:predicted lysophospholipase L1 biosynthesis ABC-type transport system permease subunit